MALPSVDACLRREGVCERHPLGISLTKHAPLNPISLDRTLMNSIKFATETVCRRAAVLAFRAEFFAGPSQGSARASPPPLRDRVKSEVEVCRAVLGVELLRRVQLRDREFRAAAAPGSSAGRG